MKLPVNTSAPLAALILLGGCTIGGHQAVAQQTALPRAPANGPAADYPVVIGQPFTIDGVTHTPIDRMNYDAVGYAAIGGDGGDGITGAHKTLPLPSYVEVTALDSGKTILVRIERRGPMTNDRLVELSPGAAAQLGLTGTERAPVRVRRVNPPEPERALLRAGQRAPERMETPKPLAAVLMRRLDAQNGVVTPPAAPLPPTSDAPPPAAAPATTAPAPVAAPMPRRPVAKPVSPPHPPAATAARPAHNAAPPATPPRATPAPASPAPDRSSTSGSVVQIAAFSTRERADAAAAKLGARVEPAGRLWRVRLGPFSSQAEAQAALAKARGAGYSDARIQRGD